MICSFLALCYLLQLPNKMCNWVSPSISFELKAIEKRISVFSQIPAENGELIQVLRWVPDLNFCRILLKSKKLIFCVIKANIMQHRYEKDQFYKPHHDYFSDTVSYLLFPNWHGGFIGCVSYIYSYDMEESWSISLQLLQFNLKRGGQRVATMLMYLSEDVEGGETYFPMVIPIF